MYGEPKKRSWNEGVRAETESDFTIHIHMKYFNTAKVLHNSERIQKDLQTSWQNLGWHQVLFLEDTQIILPEL